MKIIIRKARLSDAHDVWQINRDNWKYTFRNVYSKKRIEEKLARKPPEKDVEKMKEGVKKGYKYYVAISNGKVVGMLIYTTKKNVIDISCLYIDIKHHRLGIGSKLLTHVENKTKAKTFTVTSASRKETIDFYKKMGYRKLRTKKYKDTGDIDIVMMKRT